MKKSINKQLSMSCRLGAAFLVILMLVTLFAACGEEQEPNSEEQVSDLSEAIQQPTPQEQVIGLSEEKHFNVSDILWGDESSNNPSAGASGDFVVKEKKYTYKDENLMLLSVKSQTESHYDLTINGKYLDADGNVIKEESQTYIGFPAGWSNYFIFRPKGIFDGFEYSLSVKPCDTSNKLYFDNGEPLTQYIDITYEKNLYWGRGYPDNRDLMFNYQLINRHTSVTVAFNCHLLVLDEQGEIYAMDYDFLEVFQNGKTNAFAPPVGAPNDGFPRASLRSQAKGLDETIPENVQGKFTAIFAIESVAALYESWKLPTE